MWMACIVLPALATLLNCTGASGGPDVSRVVRVLRSQEVASDRTHASPAVINYGRMLCSSAKCCQLAISKWRPNVLQNANYVWWWVLRRWSIRQLVYLRLPKRTAHTCVKLILNELPYRGSATLY